MPPRGGRGGRGGGLVVAPRRNVPFDIDPELAQVVDGEEGREDDDKKKNEDAAKKKQTDDFADNPFPALAAYVTAAPLTDQERREVQIGREFEAKRRAGPFWTGTKEDWAKVDKEANMGSRYNPFEDAPTYGKKTREKPFKLADLSKIKMHKQILPKELYDVIGAREEDDYEIPTGIPGEGQRKRKLGLAKKSALDKLAKFDEGNEDVAVAGVEEEKEEGEKEDEDEEAEVELEDDDFDEDEEDDDNDYNAEHYFDGGEEEAEEHGGEDYDDGY